MSADPEVPVLHDLTIEPVPPRWTRDDSQALAWLLLLSALVGVIGGVIWGLIAPRPELVVTKDGVAASLYSEVFAAADLTFIIIMAILGIALTLLGLWLFRRAALGITVGLLLGGVVGSAVARRIGESIGPQFELDGTVQSGGRAVGATFAGPLSLHMGSALLVWSFLAAIIVAFEMYRRERATGREEQRVRQQSGEGSVA